MVGCSCRQSKQEAKHAKERESPHTTAKGGKRAVHKRENSAPLFLSNHQKKTGRFFFLPGAPGGIPSPLPGCCSSSSGGSLARSARARTEGYGQITLPNSSSICPSAHCPLILPLFFHLSVLAQSPIVSTCFPCLPNHLSILSPTQHSQKHINNHTRKSLLVHVGAFPAQVEYCEQGRPVTSLQASPKLAAESSHSIFSHNLIRLQLLQIHVPGKQAQPIIDGNHLQRQNSRASRVYRRREAPNGPTGTSAF